MPTSHEAADIFPMDEENLQSLADDIKANGQLVPIELMDGKILDGRRRYAACNLAGIEPETKDVAVDDPVAYVISLNLHRRHLDDSQRAMVGARASGLKDKLSAAAHERMRKGGGDKKSRAARSGVEHSPHPIPSRKTRDELGKSVGVSGRSIDRATKVLQSGSPELIAAVDEGRMAVTAAAEVADAPHEVQVREAASARKHAKSPTRPGHEQPHSSQTTTPNHGNGTGTVRQRELALSKAVEAINSLKSISANNPARKQAFKQVGDFVRHNLRSM